MTCIVAITDGKRTVLGGDSAAGSSDSTEIYNFASNKMFAKGEYLVGVCGSYRLGQIVEWEMDWPEPPAPDADVQGFVVREVVGASRRSIAATGFAGAPKAQLLVALRGQLFTITNDLAVGSLAEPWMSIGSGRHHAYGALHVVAELDLDLETKVHKALEAAERHTANVRQPFHLLCGG